MEYVQSIYGEPDNQETGSAPGFGDYASWEYGDSVKITFIQNKQDGELFIRHISVTADNGFVTPDGVKVGMDEKVLLKTYGEPFIHRKSKKGFETYQYDNDRAGYVHLFFRIVNGKIAEIALHYDI